MQQQTSAIEDAADALRVAEVRLAQAIREGYPEGSTVLCVKGGGEAVVRVHGHSDQRVLVENQSTGKRYWVGYYHLTEDRR